MTSRLPLAFAVALLLGAFAAASPAVAAPVPPGADWHEDYISESDGTSLHVDVLRPKDLPATAKTPVILSIGPYFNHSGQTGPAGPVEMTPYTPAGAAGPSDRFGDFVEGAHLMQRGYTWVMVDLRGFGGSSGCLDWAGPGEQADVKAAVEWAASQPWSTGKVGMYGKSYDAVTGLIGAALKPKGLAAVVAGEPVYDLYRYLYTNGVRFENSLATPALYDAIDETPGTIQDNPQYLANGFNDSQRPGCPALNWSDQALNSNHDSSYWKPRNLIDKARGTTMPLFMTQGFIENNTKPDGAFDFFNGLAGFKRAWFGMWDHIRGNEVDAGGRLKMGRTGWFDEVMRFYDHFVRDVPFVDAPTDKDPPVVVQTSNGTWRAEKSWPPADAYSLTTTLRAGSYTDDAQNNGTGSGAGTGIWTISPKLANDAHFAGAPRITVDVGSATPNANLTADVYDLDKDDKATLISRSTYLLGGAGKVSFDMYGDDWLIPAGHRIGVLVASSNAEWWTHIPTFSTVSVTGGEIKLPFLRYKRTDKLPGKISVKLEDYQSNAPFAVAQDVISSATLAGFALPRALVKAPKAKATKSSRGGRRLLARISVSGKRVVVYGNAPKKSRVTVRLLRGSRTIGVRHVKAKLNAFRVTFRARGSGRYRATVTAKLGRRSFRARTRAARVR
jgi:predicted acyl esterase